MGFSPTRSVSPKSTAELYENALNRSSSYRGGRNGLVLCTAGCLQCLGNEPAQQAHRGAHRPDCVFRHGVAAAA